MENVGLKLVLEAEAQGAVKGISAVTKSLGTITPAAAKAGKSLNDIGKASNGAGQALSNLGRVAQDAPFGFIGIQNNLSPLLESFQRLKVEAGGTKGALKALGSSLIGSGGLGLAFSAIQAAVLFSQMGFRAWGASAKKAEEEVSALATAVKDFASNGFADAGKQITEVNRLMAAISDLTLTEKQRSLAVDEIQAKYPAYFGNLSKEKILAGETGDAYDRLKTEILLAAKARAAGDVLSKIAAQQLANEEKQANITAKAISDMNKARTGTSKVIGGSSFGGGTSQVTVTREEKVAQLQAGLLTNLKDLKQEQEDLNKQADFYVKFVNDGAAATANLETKVDKVKKVTEKATKAAKELKEAIRATINEGVASSDPQNQLILNGVLKFREEQIKQEIKSVQDFVKAVNNGPEAPTLTLKMDANIQQVIDSIEKAKKAAEAKMRSLLDGVNQAIQQTIVRGISAIADAVGQLISGSSVNGLATFIGVIAEGLSAIGQAMVAYGVAKVALSKLNLAGPAAIAIGFGLEVLASVLKAKVSQVKFATGGIVTGPTNALIGEAGPEVVFPLNKLDSFLSDRQGSSQPIVLTTAVRGQDLILIQQRAGSSFKRTNG